MNEYKSKTYDLEDRTYKSAYDCRILVKIIAKNIQNIEDGKQLIKSSGSVAANYIEANEALSKKDFSMRIKICRKEAKESSLWLRLVDQSEDKDLNKERLRLLNESKELMLIFSSIMHKSK